MGKVALPAVCLLGTADGSARLAWLMDGRMELDRRGAAGKETSNNSKGMGYREIVRGRR